MKNTSIHSAHAVHYTANNTTKISFLLYTFYPTKWSVVWSAPFMVILGWELHSSISALIGLYRGDWWHISCRQCMFFFFFISKWHSFTLESTHSFINEVTNLGTVTKLSTLTCKEKWHLYETFADNEWQLVMLNNSTSFTAGNFYAPINY